MHNISTNHQYLADQESAARCATMHGQQGHVIFDMAFMTAFTSLRWGLKQHREILYTVSDAAT